MKERRKTDRERLLRLMDEVPPRQAQEVIKEFDGNGVMTREKVIFKSVEPSIEDYADAIIADGWVRRKRYEFNKN